MATIRNGIISVAVTAETGTEVPTTAQAKAWLKMGYSTDDTLIEGLIKTARKYAESYCSISIIAKTIRVVFTHDGEKPVRIPQGPVGTVSLVRFRSCRLKDWTTITTETDNWEISEGEYISNYVGYHEVTYAAGYANGTQPQSIIDALKRIITRLYERRGEEKGFSLEVEEMDLLNLHAERFWA